MGLGEAVEGGGVGQVDARADDVLERGAGLVQRVPDDLEAAPRLAVGVGGQVEPSAMIGADPATNTLSPTRTARE